MVEREAALRRQRPSQMRPLGRLLVQLALSKALVQNRHRTWQAQVGELAIRGRNTGGGTGKARLGCLELGGLLGLPSTETSQELRLCAL